MNTTPRATLTFFAVLCWISVSQQRITRPTVITIRKSDESSTYGSVNGATQCGGPGEFVQFRISGCDPTKPCQLPAHGDTLHAEIDFIPIIDMTAISVKITRWVDGGAAEVDYEKTLENLDVKKGVKHTLFVAALADTDLAGKKIKSKWEIINAADNSLRVCMEAEYQWVKAED